MCSIENCENKIHSKGLCQNHYRQAQRKERGLKSPGAKRDPSKPHSKYKDKSFCSAGHEYGDREDSRGHRICEICSELKAKTECPQGHPYSVDNLLIRSDGARACKTCQRERMKDRRPASGIGIGGVNKAKTHCKQGHEYTEENTARYGNRRTCKTCARENTVVQNAKRYGKTTEDIKGLLSLQNNACLVCLREFSATIKPAIDHDHLCCEGPFSCGNCVRGLLCGWCNPAIGMLQDSPENLRRAASYIENYRTNNSKQPTT